MASVLLLLVTSLTNVLANNCCRQQMVTGSISLDGVYTLVEERPFIDLAPRDRDICQSGCVYARSGSPSHEEYCFAESPSTSAASCSAFGETESLMLERVQLVEEIDTLNRSYVLGLNEVATRKDVLNQVEAAKEMVGELLQASARAARFDNSAVRQMDGEVVCSSTVDLVTKLAIALAISDTEQTQTLAAQLINSALLPCSSSEREELSTNLVELASKQEEEEEAILQLESQLDALVVTIRQLEEQVAAITLQLVEQLGEQMDGVGANVQVDDSDEVPLILQDNERLQLVVEEEEELPFALPLHVIATNDFLI